MKPQRRPYLILAVGFIVFFFWTVCLYWCQAIQNLTASDFIHSSVNIDNPRGLKVEIPDIKTYCPGKLFCVFDREEFFDNTIIGPVHSIPSLVQKPTIEFEPLYTGKFTWLGFAYDNTMKQFVVQQINCGQEKQTRKTIGYIGPKGYSATYNPSLGTFDKPQLLKTPNTSLNPTAHPVFPLYDSAARRFYRIELDAQPKPQAKYFYYIPFMDSIKITEGPVQNQPDWAPVQIDNKLSGHANYVLNYDFLQIRLNPPSRIIHRFRDGYAEKYPGIDPNTIHEDEIVYKKSIVLDKIPIMAPLTNDFFVLHQNGKIDYLDGKALSVVRCAGTLPEVGFYENSKSSRPLDMVDYEAQGIYDPNGLYAGMVVAAVSRDGFNMAMSFYDAKGNLSDQDYLGGHSYERALFVSVSKLMNRAPSGSLFLTIRYLLENLQSPLLRLLDIPAAKWISPKNHYNTMFVHPNSFIGLMKFDYTSLGFLLFLMAPSLVISTWLGFKARKKAASLGYDELSRDAWFVTVIAFGIPAYITFRLTVPTQRMVTCANCGNLRRVEFETCQSCKRDWQKTRDLTTAPAWTVRDSGMAVTAEDIKK